MAPLKCAKDPSRYRGHLTHTCQHHDTIKASSPLIAIYIARPDFSLRQVTVYLGQHDIARRRMHRSNRFKPREIVIHPEYVRNERDQVSA